MLVRRGQRCAEEWGVTNWVEGLFLSIPAISRASPKVGSPYTELTGEIRNWRWGGNPALATAHFARSIRTETGPPLRLAALFLLAALILFVAQVGASHNFSGVRILETLQRFPREPKLFDLVLLHLTPPQAGSQI